jgi:hypothetical protein
VAPGVLFVVSSSSSETRRRGRRSLAGSLSTISAALDRRRRICLCLSILFVCSLRNSRGSLPLVPPHPFVVRAPQEEQQRRQVRIGENLETEKYRNSEREKRED